MRKATGRDEDALVVDLLGRWHSIAGKDVKYNPAESPKAAIHLRWWCLRLIRATQARFPHGVSVETTVATRRTEAGTRIEVHPRVVEASRLRGTAAAAMMKAQALAKNLKEHWQSVAKVLLRPT